MMVFFPTNAVCQAAPPGRPSAFRNQPPAFMRKTIATVIILGLVWIGYIAWPLYELLVLVRAMETRDLATVTRGVYFDAVRASLTSQVVAAYVRRTRINIGPLGQSVAARALWIADP